MPFVTDTQTYTPASLTSLCQLNGLIIATLLGFLSSRLLLAAHLLWSVVEIRLTKVKTAKVDQNKQYAPLSNAQGGHASVCLSPWITWF